MSDIIHLLPDSVANQIAAGEVIQRPASVVKELVENAIDAGATEVHVLVTDAGRTCIQVIDNGRGMSETDARLAFERHATSKISQAADLFDLHTMGFRGEALASIAAVAEVELKTRLEGEDLGTRLVLSGTRLQVQEPVACPRGSNFQVRNLFFNVPARRKFLKSNATELSNVLQEFERIVLVHPDTAFFLYSNDAEVFHLAATTLRQRILAVFGKRLNGQLLDLTVDTSLVRISGFVGRPDSARRKGAHQYFFVNGRYMRHPYFHRAVMDAYQRLVPQGEQVPYFVYMEVPPASIDINIHPTKTEIKFENEQAIWQILAAAVREALGRFSAIPSIDFDTADRPDLPPFSQGNGPVSPPQVRYNDAYNPFRSSPEGNSSARRATRDWEKLFTGLERPAVTSADGESPHADPFAPGAEPVAGSDNASGVGQVELQRDEPGAPSADGGGEPLFPGEGPAGTPGVSLLQVHGRYILTSVHSGLLLIDQHRAHVRILFDRYMQQISRQQGLSQGVLFPSILTLPASEATVLEGLQTDLQAVGFDLTSLGGGNYAIQGVPSGIEGLDPAELVRNMVHTAVESGSDVRQEIQAILADTLAQATAIVYGQVLSQEEMTRLVDGLFACSQPGFTPDGHPVLATISEDDIARLFR